MYSHPERDNMKKRNYEILEKDYQMPKIDEKTIEGILNHPKFYRGHLRTALGKIYTTDEFKKHSDEVLGRKLP